MTSTWVIGDGINGIQAIVVGESEFVNTYFDSLPGNERLQLVQLSLPKLGSIRAFTVTQQSSIRLMEHDMT